MRSRRKTFKEFFTAQPDFMLVRLYVISHFSSIGQFTKGFLSITDRERLNLVTAPLAVKAATALESRPPLRNTPTGTSLMRCDDTAPTNSSRYRLTEYSRLWESQSPSAPSSQ